MPFSIVRGKIAPSRRKKGCRIFAAHIERTATEIKVGANSGVTSAAADRIRFKSNFTVFALAVPVCRARRNPFQSHGVSPVEDEALKSMRYLENDRERLCRNIRREMSGEMVSRFFRSLPAFQTADAMPAPFGDLLARLEAKEDGGRLRCC